ncbi:chemotaxis protein CheB [Paracoccus sp. (in: a-proteobacteria)]|uniref:chemotaxis protein CheB n=1 Tax=Paracoccus sp. TaxID=267 RepID=UPI00272CEF70|nr:chemotaxis protein CheB [Paracoccus sp. (in: a-proteobacteria)]
MNDASGPEMTGQRAAQTFAVVGIGASAGGLEALHDLLRAARRQDPAAYVVIQHLDPTHDSVLAELLDRRTELTVEQARDGTQVVPGHVYTIPPGARLLIEGGRLKLTGFDQPRGLRRPIDDFFESLAHDQGAAAACVILSGTGADGTLGLRAIKEHGGICVVQEPRTARYDGMPLSAEATGLVDFVLTPEQIVPTLLQFFESSHEGMAEEAMIGDARRICDLLRDRTGHDFRGYKISTLLRRIRRRMQVHGLADSRAYLRHLDSSPDECEALLNEFLINVTRFFRDREAFEALRDKAIRPLVQAHQGDDLRVWVPGCSSGEEAYSIAMLLDSEMRAAGRRPRFTVFASDIDRRMIDVARGGTYPISALVDIPEELRHDYTSHRDGLMRIVPQLRDRVRFSLHSLVRDPPFNRVDLISCRNLLIYLDEDLQSRVLPLFHYALRPGGYLLLGPSEGVRREAIHFTELDRQARLYRRDEAPARLPLDLPFTAARSHKTGETQGTPRGAPVPSEIVQSAQRRVLDRHAPAALQVSRSGEVLWSSGRLARFVTVDPAARGPVLAAAVVSKGLREAVTRAIEEVTATERPLVMRDLVARSELGRQPVTLTAEPLPDRSVLLVFRETGPLAASEEGQPDYDELTLGESQSERLEEELRLTQMELRSAVEELETANEELKSSNEEMMSMNEELQSTNEELSTVNDELKSKIDDLTSANSDLQNFFSATKIPLLVVDRDIRVRNFTAAALQIFPLRRSDHGRPLADVSNVFGGDLLERMAREVVTQGEAQGCEIAEPRRHRSWRVDVKPYRGPDGHLQGAMLVFDDVTALRDLRQAVERQNERLTAVRSLARIAVWQFDADNRSVTIDDSSDLLGIGRTANLPLTAFAALIDPTDRDAFLADIEACLTGASLRRVLTPATDPQTRIEAAGQRLSEDADCVLGVMLDVTAVETSARLREAVISEMDHRVKNLFTQIAAMLRMAARETDEAETVVEEVSARINALAQSHSLTTRRGASVELDLAELVGTTLAPYDAAKSSHEGPPVKVRAGQVVPLSLILHELATNAFKYGVLGPIPGHLDVTWTCGERTELVWAETYSADRETETPDEGFGSVLLEGAAAQLGAALEVDQQPGQRITRFSF